MILEEGHKSCLSIHYGMTKMYKELKQDVIEFVSTCLVFQKFKVEPKRPGGMLQQLDIP